MSAERKIKVLYIQHHGSGGGAPRSLTFLIKNLPGNLVDPVILTPPGGAIRSFREVTDQVFEIGELPEITSIAGGNFFYLRCLKTLVNYRTLAAIVQHVKKVKPDIVHLNDLSLTLVARACRKLNCKVVMHARVVLSDKVPFLNRMIRWMMNRYVHRVIAIDGSVSGKLKGVRNVSIVYNPLHVNLATARTESKSTECNVLFLANLITYKGIFDLLEAAKKLKDQQNIRFFIAGANSRPAEFFRTFKGKVLSRLGIVPDNETKVKHIIETNNLEQVTFIGHVNNINEWIMRTDVLVFPSHMNGPSRSIFEAGAMGVPSILALKDKVEDVVSDGKNGVIIPERSAEALASAIMDLALHPDKRIALGRAAVSHFRELNDAKKSGDQVARIYADLVGRG